MTPILSERYTTFADSNQSRFLLIRKSDNTAVSAHMEGLVMSPDSGELYQGSLNVTGRYRKLMKTGLFTAEQEPVFEHDILDEDGHHYIVIWNPSHLQFIAYPLDKGAITLTDIMGRLYYQNLYLHDADYREAYLDMNDGKPMTLTIKRLGNLYEPEFRHLLEKDNEH